MGWADVVREAYTRNNDSAINIEDGMHSYNVSDAQKQPEGLMLRPLLLTQD